MSVSTTSTPQESEDAIFPLMDNGIKPELKHNINYDATGIRTMTSPEDADAITIELASLRTSKEDGLTIYEYHPGLGSQTISMLKNDTLSVIAMTYSNKESDLLRNNLVAYQINKDYYSIHVGDVPINSSHDGTAVVLFELPLYINDLSKSIFDIEIPARGDRKVKIVDIMTRSESSRALAFAFVLNKDVEIADEEFEELHYVVRRNIIGSKLLILAVLERIILIKSIVIPDMPQPKTTREKLKTFLRNVMLPKATTSVAIIEQLLDDKYMSKWEAAFTHTSVNSMIGQNYERYEKIGDSIMEALFYKFIVNKFPRINEDRMTKMASYYLKGTFQTNIGRDLGLGNYIYRDVMIDATIIEDVVESYFGALSTIGDMALGVIKSHGLCHNTFYAIYNNLDVSERFGIGHPRTRLLEIFSKLGCKAFQPTVKTNMGSMGTNTWYTSQVFFNYKNCPEVDRRLHIKSGVLGSGKGNTAKEAETFAHNDALNFLEELGITWEAVNQESRKTKIDVLGDAYSDAREKALKDGYYSIDFEEPGPRQKKRINFIVLYGRKRVSTGGKTEIIKEPLMTYQHTKLHTISESGKEEQSVNYDELKLEVLRKYVNIG